MWKKVRVGKNGRITIPVEFRRKLGIKEGDILEIEALEGKIVLRPVPK
jgi:AbrB family looped-hinge helix DNA binding protein